MRKAMIMDLTTNGFPAMAAKDDWIVAVVTTPEGDLVWTSWELGSSGTWTRVSINGPIRQTNVAPAVSFATFQRTKGAGAVRPNSGGGGGVWLAITDAGDNHLYTTQQQADGSFEAWTLIPGVLTTVSPAVSPGKLAGEDYPIMAVVAASPDDSTYLNVDLSATLPPPPENWKAVTPPLLTALAPALSIVDQGNYLFLAVTALNLEGPNGRVMLNQGNPSTPD